MPRSIFSRASRVLTKSRPIEAALARGLEPARALPHVRDVRVKGAIGVVELDRIDDLSALRRRFIEAGVFVRPIRNIVYLTPAFTIGEEDLSASPARSSRFSNNGRGFSAGVRSRSAHSRIGVMPVSGSTSGDCAGHPTVKELCLDGRVQPGHDGSERSPMCADASMG